MFSEGREDRVAMRMYSRREKYLRIFGEEGRR